MKRGLNAALGIVITAAVYFLFFLTGIRCPIRFLTGISCCGCGMTRALMRLFALDIQGALYYHPLIFFIPVYAVLFIVRKKFREPVFRIITGIFVLIFLAVYFTRLFDPENIIVTANLKDGCIFKILHYIMEG